MMGNLYAVYHDHDKGQGLGKKSISTEVCIFFFKLLFIRYDTYMYPPSGNWWAAADHWQLYVQFINLFFPRAILCVQPFTTKRPRKQAISHAMVKPLIIGCSMPISLVEQPHFRAFMEVCEDR